MPVESLRSELSMNSMRGLFQQQYDRWVLAVTLLGLIGYSVTSVVHVFRDGLWHLFAHADPYVVVLCAIALALARRSQPERAALIVLAAAGADMHLAFFTTGQLDFASALALPLYVLGAGLLFGRRAALGVALILAVTSPVAAIAGSLVFKGGLTVPEDPFVPIGVELVVIGTGVLLHGFFRTFEMVVLRAQQGARYTAEILQVSPYATIGLDAQERIDAFNAAAVRLLGIPVEDAIGQALAGLRLRDEQGAPVTGVSAFRDSQHALTLCVEDSDTVLEALARTTTRPDGTEGLLVVLRDVTQRRRAEEQARSLQEQLLHTQKMDAVGQLAGGVAHDFNNLLTVIGGLAYSLAQEPNENAQNAAQQLLAAQEHGASLTQQLLAFARKDVVELRPLDLSSLLLRMGTLIRRACGETIRLRLNVQPSCVVVGDTGQLEQIILNLVTNARDAMPDGGDLHVETSLDGGRVELLVRDTGIGIAEEFHSRVFEPFFTTKGRGRGTGLGLSTVHGLVVQSGGSIELQSAPGRGTTFTLRWPLATGVPDALPVAAPAPESLRGTELILLAEDNDWVRTFVRDVLQRNGYQVVAASDGDEALREAERLDSPPALLLTDVVMPGFRGPALARQLERKFRNLPALFISGYLDDVVEDELAGRLLRKPFAAEELLLRVREELDRRTNAGPTALAKSPPPEKRERRGHEESLVVVIDDETMVREAMASALSVIGYPAVAFESLEQAEQQADGRSACLVLIDWRMPGISGEQAVARVREVWPGCQVAIVSGDLSEIPSATRELVLDAVQKPVSMRSLKALAERAACAAGETEF